MDKERGKEIYTHSYNYKTEGVTNRGQEMKHRSCEDKTMANVMLIGS
jgi:hypothetical protein